MALIDDPAGVLGPPVAVTARRTEPEPVPGWTAVAAWHRAAIRRRRPRAYLRGRGLTTAALREHMIGWDGDAYTFPVFAGGDLVNLIRHVPGGRPKYRALAGHEAALYPD